MMPTTNMIRYPMSSILILLTVATGTFVVNCEETTVKSACNSSCACRDEGTDFMVDCSRRQLTSVPLNIPSKTTILYLNQNMISEIAADALAGMTNLRKLYLQQNLVGNLPGNLFQSNQLLQTFHVQKNNLSELPPNLFSTTRQIEDINLSRNRLKALPKALLETALCLNKLDISSNLLEELHHEIFHGTPNLRQLNMGSNVLKSLPNDMFQNTENLSYLFLQRNGLRTLPTRLFASLVNLKSLYMGSNLMRSLPYDMFQNTQNLSFLYFSNNLLEELSPTLFSKTPNLTNAYFNNNSLQEIPRDLFSSTPNIKLLDFSFNKITSVNQATFSRATKLITLHLNGNGLTSVPGNLLEFTGNLINLELSDNNLQVLPESLFSNLTKLRQVRFAGNSISRLSPTLFRNMSTLNSIDMSLNSLSNIPETLLVDTVTLVSFHASANNIKQLPDELFIKTPNLTNISFSFNELTEIPENIFNATPSLSMIDFVYNRLTELPKHVFDAVGNLTYLQMSANKFENINTHLFSKVRLMDELDFSNNSLSIIPSGLFSSNNRSHELRTIFLQRNNVTYVQKDAFNGLLHVVLICLYDNQINAIDSGAFSIKSLQKLFLFKNDLHNLTNRSFADSKLQELHLYGNNITNISKNATDGISTESEPMWYLSCELLRTFDTADIKITCINEKFAPRLIVDEQVSHGLQSEGFICSKCRESRKYQCELCKPGTYTFGDNRCYACPKGGFFQDAIGFKSSSSSNIGCKKCNNGTFVRSEGGNSAENCKVCPDGTNKSMHAGFRACFCRDGYARTDRFGPCYRCNQTGLNCSGLQDYQSIKKGFYWFWKFPEADNEAYRKFVMNLLNESNIYDDHTNYSQQIPRVFKCPRPESCNTNQTGDAPVRGTCTKGYHGWLCNKCSPGYFSLLKKCIKCPNKMKLLAEAFFTTALSVLICYSIWTQYAKQKKKNIDERNLLDIIVSRFKICLGFYQVLGEFFSSIQEASWMGMFNFMGEIFSYITLNVLRMFFRPQCVQESLHINPKIQFLISVFVIFLLTAFPISLYQLRKIYLQRYSTSGDIKFKLSILRAKISTICLVLLFLTYPPICTAIFQLYRRSCVEFCADLKNKRCLFVLRSDFEINCAEVVVYQVFAYLLTVVYIAAFPLSLFFLLRKYCSPKITTVMVDTENANGDTAPLLAVDFDHIHVPIGLKFLCENYKPQFWFWEIVELTRKVTQTVLVTLLGWEDYLTILLTIGVSVLYLTLHARYRPMKSDLEQRLQMYSLSVILINVLVATISMAVPDGFGSTLAIMILLLNVSIVVIIMVEATVRVVVTIRRMKNYKQSHFPHPQQMVVLGDIPKEEEKE